MLENKGIEKDSFSGPKGSTNRGYGQPAQLVEELVDRLWSFDQGPVEGSPKPSLFASSLLFPVEAFLLPIEVRLRQW